MTGAAVWQEQLIPAKVEGSADVSVSSSQGGGQCKRVG